MSASDPTELRPEQFHPAARSAYRWLKGFMMKNTEDYQRYKLAMQTAADSGNLQAKVCPGTIERLATGQPVSDRYLLGLSWTVLAIHNKGELESIADARLDRAYGQSDDEFSAGDAS